MLADHHQRAGLVFWSGPVWVVITEGFVIVATITALILLRQRSSRFAFRPRTPPRISASGS